MESEKSLKCGECDAKFSSPDNLIVHQRRHEMTLNLSTKSIFPVGPPTSSLSTPSISKGSHSAGVIGCFVDETPTPTRFIRNCEEVGLFQDLQNVNPFDEDFRKAAATGTPTGEGFEFTFSAGVVGVLGTPISNFQETPLCLKTPSRTKRRYSDQDTLNTPQVFPFNFSSTASGGGCQTTTTTTSSNTTSVCLTPSSSLLTAEGIRNVNIIQGPQALQVESPKLSTTSYNHEEHVSIIAYTSAISQQTKTSGDGKVIESPKTASELVKSLTSNPTTPTPPLVPTNKDAAKAGRISLLKRKSHLKLDLKNVISKNKNLAKCSVGDIDRPSNSVQIKDPEAATNSEKKELLERNRAAAHRSRERRKQWIYGLESRCRALETLLAESQAEVSRLKEENESLRNRLGEKEVEKRPSLVLAVNSTSSKKESKSKETLINSIIVPAKANSTFQEPLAADSADTTDLGGGMVASIVSPIVLPTVKAKRGRPRKGEERRVSLQSVAIPDPLDTSNMHKIPILPLARILKKT